MDHIRLETLKADDLINGLYIVNAVQLKVTVSGKPFLSCHISDASGGMDAKLWGYVGSITAADNGKVARIEGKVEDYKGNLQLNLSNIYIIEAPQPGDLTDLIPTAPIDVEASLQGVKDMLNGLTDPDYRAIALKMADIHWDRFKKIPAAKSVHHWFLYGLLMHTYHMMQIADYMASQYSDIVDRSLLIAGTFMHDLQKEEEFVFSDLGLVTDYSAKGQLLGHLVMGSEQIDQVGRKLGVPESKVCLLQHMVLSHHGEPEFGAAVVPMFIEAELLHRIDVLDARMEIYRDCYQKMKPGEFSDKIFALGHKIYKHE